MQTGSDKDPVVRRANANKRARTGKCWTLMSIIPAPYPKDVEHQEELASCLKKKERCRDQSWATTHKFQGTWYSTIYTIQNEDPHYIK